MEDKKPEENKMEIEISKYKNLVDALGDPVRVARMVILIATVAAILAVGIIAIVCGIKRFYPYKSINSNPYGATIIQDEDNEIIYWLFNSADLWANSGIEVKEGDVISVRTSGAYHTAIHHLVNDANNNTKLDNPWSHSKGDSPSKESPLYDRSKARSMFRIAPDHSKNTILMQVIPSDIGGNNSDVDWRTDKRNAYYVDGREYIINKVTDHYKSGSKTEKEKPDIYEIGLGKENIRIRTNGILHFAVNDIALTRRIISQMERDTAGLKLDTVKGVWFAKTTDKLDSFFTPAGLKLIKPTYYVKANEVDSLKKTPCGQILAWLIDNKKNDTIRRDTISSEEWNLQHFKQIGLVDNFGRPIEKYWKKGALKNPEIVNTCKYSNDSIWNDMAYLNRMGLIISDTISLKDSLMVAKYGYKTDSILDDSYQKRMGFTKSITKSIIKKAYPRMDYIIDSSYLIRYTIRENKFNCLADLLFDSLYLRRLGLLEKVWQPYELEYYRYHNFVDAWFADNIGSFMIVIERKKVK